MRIGNCFGLRYNFMKMYQENRYILTGTFQYIFWYQYRYQNSACFGSPKNYQKSYQKWPDIHAKNTLKTVLKHKKPFISASKHPRTVLSVFLACR